MLVSTLNSTETPNSFNSKWAEVLGKRRAMPKRPSKLQRQMQSNQVRPSTLSGGSRLQGKRRDEQTKDESDFMWKYEDGPTRDRPTTIASRQ